MRTCLVCLTILFSVACTTSRDPDSDSKDHGSDPTDHGSDPTDPDSDPTDSDSGTNPNAPSLAERGLSAEISAVSLANDCTTLKDAPLVDCEPGKVCSVPCQQTSVQIVFDSDGPTKTVTVRVLEARLFAKETGDLLDTLSARAPSQWVESIGGYQSWDQQLPPRTQIKAKYDLDGPKWSETADAPSTLFYMEVDVEIDGTVTTLESGEISREPEITT